MSTDSMPTNAQLAKMQSLPMDAPVAALNFFKFNERAAYQPDDPEFGTADANVSGEEALGRYLVQAGEKLAAVGGKVVFRSTVDQVMIGPDDLEFDVVAIMWFPTRSAFIEMMSDPTFQASSRHRYAALAKHNMIHLAGDAFSP